MIQYMENHKLALVVKEIDEQKLKRSRVCAEYSKQCGEKGVLNVEHYIFICRVHVILDISHGSYCAKHLHNCYHYQIPVSKLWSFLKDTSKQGRNIGIAGIEVFEKQTNMEGTFFSRLMQTCQMSFCIHLMFNFFLQKDQKDQHFAHI